ncbi:unnamed protein product (macronuclear) [Paramecium tetraurelia]|uniref:SPRY domain-containing protein n=1 Tax=Paramecium tetraurelia TaxID=5888 RepID=A0CJ64_PARTE|nr:uncharacterized protein GSPATT00038613001 [Paramecium tetraurelia]CAK70831.1 unnamed protein product [Paramecium tetraurelia]|eukprot:XP_001438228.1 hypothetical protein (macronuclear) [Paramecium tetraurelia strain d4-2]
MIDMDSQNKKIEDRFVCVDCIFENPLIKYQTIENVNKLWIDYNQESENIFSNYKKESKNKRNDLFNQITQMRRNYNQKLNEISEKLISEQFLSIHKSKEINQIKRISIQTLQNEQLLNDLTLLIEKEKVNQGQKMSILKNKESIFQQEIENHLESLKQIDQLDIQQSIDILKQIPLERNVIFQLQEHISQFSNCAQTKDQNQIKFIKDILKLIDQAKKYQCQINLFDQTINLFQMHNNTIDQIQQQILNQTKDQINNQYQNLSTIINDYINTFDNKSKQIKKYCSIEKLEGDLLKLTEINKNLENEKTNLLNKMSKQLVEKQQEYQKVLEEQQTKNQNQIDELTIKLQSKEKENQNFKELFDQKTQEILNLKKQKEEDKLQLIKNLEDNKKKQVEEMAEIINQKESEFQNVQRQLDQINQENVQKEIQLKLELEKIKQYPKILVFSNTYKHPNCQVSEGGKVVENISSSWLYCLCEQAIPKNGKTLFAFQMISGTYFNVGIGFRDIIQKNNYDLEVGNGQYLITHNGYTFSHHNKNVDNKQLSFTFTTNDVIIIEVSIEHKYIKWTRQNNSLATVMLEIDTSLSQELYSCVYFYQSKIKILDNIPN